MKVAVVADDPRSCTMLRMVLPSGIRLLEDIPILDSSGSVLWQRPDAVIVDSDDDAHTLRWMVRRVLSVLNSTPVIVLSSDRSDETIVGAIHDGAYDYVVKPYEIERLITSIQRAVMYCATQYALDSREAGESGTEKFLGDSRLAREVRETVRAYSEVDAPVLLVGESGTGKDLVARLIHSRSPRSSGPFTPVNCAAIPDTLVESELFGSERGAFTDAVSRAGLFERTYGGTLFLDEIGETSPHVQAKLLRALESRSVVRVGGCRPTPIDFRIVTATNRDVGRRVSDGLFRDDLYYRISVLALRVPPLRERVEDIPVLARHWLANHGRETVGFSPVAMERLVEHDWPGNVRELRNVVHRSALLSKGDVIKAHEIVFDPR